MDLLLSYSKRAEIADDLATNFRKLSQAFSDKQDSCPQSVHTDHERSRTWVCDRMTEGDIQRLVARYHAGATIHEAAAESNLALAVSSDC